ncbi:hypothetical protein QAD02_019652 [Eretmocerus hayati]|uniref:Uncharacterized protein n=1 Tax=Eretmocerus hayati TaxID=131215 RepID=A0ACC2PJV3_9HYME|nr:hypothetical protein QAD02_019652 [Eretmocerus hayati]
MEVIVMTMDEIFTEYVLSWNDDCFDEQRQYFRSKGHGSGGGNNKGALSALTLLAFLFLLNVMQQCLQENNSTETTTPAAILLREGQQPISLVAEEDGAIAETRDSVKNLAKEKTEEKTKPITQGFG